MSGMIGRQPLRDEFKVQESDLDLFLMEAQELATKNRIDIALVIKAAEVLELQRSNNARIQQGDYWDEQIAGLNETLEKLIESIQEVSQNK